MAANTSRTQPALVVVALALACGGRLVRSGDTGGGSGTSNGASSSEPTPDDDPGNGGSGGGSVGIGGAGVGMAGTPVTTGGTLIGTAGTNAGNPLGDRELCGSYCAAYAERCSAAPDDCLTSCVQGLAAPGTACGQAERTGYECIAHSLRDATGTCIEALLYTSKLCSPVTRKIMGCGNGACLQHIGGSGDGTCHAIATCANGISDLRCMDRPEGGIQCFCLVNAQPMFDIVNDLPSAKLGCVDEEMFAACWIAQP